MSTQEEKNIKAEVELEMAEMDHHVKMGEALNRLRQNEDFKTLILHGYLEQSVLAKVSLLAVDQIKQQGRRPDIMEDLIAASNLQNFFLMIDNFYEGAKNPAMSDEELEEISAEQGAH
jgi:hypothetical protein